MNKELFEKYVYKINLFITELEHTISSSEEIDKVKEEILEMYGEEVPFTTEQYKYLKEKEEYVSELMNILED